MMYKSLWRGRQFSEGWSWVDDDSVDKLSVIHSYQKLLREFKYLESDWETQRDRANQFELEAQQMGVENSNLHEENIRLQTQLDKAVRDYEYWRDKYLCEINNRQVLYQYTPNVGAL